MTFLPDHVYRQLHSPLDVSPSQQASRGRDPVRSRSFLEMFAVHADRPWTAERVADEYR